MMMLMMAMAMPAAAPLSAFLLKRHDVDKRMPPPLLCFVRAFRTDLGRCYRGLDPSFTLPSICLLPRFIRGPRARNLLGEISV